MRLLRLIAANLTIVRDNFCDRTVINGAKYLHSSRSHPTRLFWRIVLCTLSTVSFLIIQHFYDQYLRNALITVLELTPEGEVYDFPSVFVCPDDVWNDDQIKKLSLDLKTFHNLSIDTNELVNCMSAIVGMYQSRNYIPKNCFAFLEAVKSRDVQINATELFLAPSDIIQDCYFKDYFLHCGKRFVPYFTEQGLCFVFNSRFAQNSETQRNEEQFKLIEYESSWNLRFKLRKSTATTKIFLKNIIDMVTVRDLPDGEFQNENGPFEILFQISENRGSNVLRELSIRHRGCIFRDELLARIQSRNQTIQEINEDICLMKCQEAIIFKSCNCFIKAFSTFEKFSFPNCTWKELNCVIDTSPKLLKPGCNGCLIHCNNIGYASSRNVLHTDLQQDRSKDKGDFQDVTIGLSSWPVYRCNKTIIYGIFDLLVSFAGVAGYFFGFSFIAFFEVFYFCVVQFFTNFLTKKGKIAELSLKQEAIIEPINLNLNPRKKF